MKLCSYLGCIVGGVESWTLHETVEFFRLSHIMYMADSIVAIPLTTGGLGDGGWKVVVAFSITDNRYNISSSEYDIGCIVTASYGSGAVLTPYYFLSSEDTKSYQIYYKIPNQDTIYHSSLLSCTNTSISFTGGDAFASIILFKQS